MAKAAEAFRNIGEVSAELGVKKHVLRFWEMRFPQLKPMKRGGGRRLYRPADVELLRGILHLLQSAGYTIKGVQKILRERGVEAVKLSDNGRTAGAPGRSLPRLVSAPAPTDRPVTLSSLEVRTLRTIMAELDACQALLAASMGGESGERPCERAER